jgi:hypothetical protein
MYPALIREILDASAAGRAEALCSKIYRTTTIRDLALAQGGIAGLGSSYREETSKRLEYCQMMVRALGRLDMTPPLPTAYALVTWMRKKWGLDNDSLAPITTLTPWAAVPVSRSVDGSISAHLRIKRGEDICLTRGIHVPYLGIATREQRAGDEWKIRAERGSAGKVIRLVKLTEEYIGDMGICELVSRMLQAYTSTPVEDIARRTARRVGGTTGHRLDISGRAAYHSHGSATALSNIVISANNAGQLADDYPLAVQEYYLVTSAILRALAMSGRYPGKTDFGLAVVPDTAGVVTLHDIPLTCPRLPTGLAPLPRCAGLYVGELSFKKIAVDRPAQFRDVSGDEPNPYIILRTAYFSALMTSGQFRASMARGASGGDGRVRTAIDHAGFKAFSLDEHISAAAACSVAAAVSRTLTTYRGNPELTVPLLANLDACATALASTMASLIPGQGEDSTYDILESGGVVWFSGSGMPSRTGHLATMILEAAGRQLKAGRYWCGTVYSASDSTAGVAFVRAWAYCTLASCIGLERRYALVRSLNDLAEAEKSTDTRASNIVAAMENVPIAPETLERVRNAVAGAAQTPPVIFIEQPLLQLCRELRSVVPHAVVGRGPLALSAVHPDFSIVDTGPTILAQTALEGMIKSGTEQQRLGRHSDRAPGGVTTSLLTTFVSALVMLEGGNRGLVIGAGGGAASAALLLGGTAKVHEVDLLSIRPHVDQEGASARSPEVQACCGRLGRGAQAHPATLLGRDVLADPSQIGTASYDRCVIDVQSYPDRPDLESILAVIVWVRAHSDSGVSMAVRLLLYSSEVGPVGKAIGQAMIKTPYVVALSYGEMNDVVFISSPLPSRAESPWPPTCVYPAVVVEPEDMLRRLTLVGMRTGVGRGVTRLAVVGRHEEACNTILTEIADRGEGKEGWLYRALAADFFQTALNAVCLSGELRLTDTSTEYLESGEVTGPGWLGEGVRDTAPRAARRNRLDLAIRIAGVALRHPDALRGIQGTRRE